MLITREQSASHLIHAIEQGRVRIGEHWFTGNVIVTADTIVSDWAVADPDRLTADDLAPILEFEPELIVLGLGETRRLPDVELMADLAAHAVGLESMRTSAACRTYNVLVHEGRRVAAALILDETGSRHG
jgi:uncharacterized protein